MSVIPESYGGILILERYLGMYTSYIHYLFMFAVWLCAFSESELKSMSGSCFYYKQETESIRILKNK